jgi:hypothetical protein
MTMTNIEQSQAARLLVLKTIHEATNGSLINSVTGQDLLNQLGMTDEELGDACAFLEDKGLIRSHRLAWAHHTPYSMNITRRGIEEIEQSLQTPSEPTRHLPAATSVIYIRDSNLFGSPIQSGSPGATQKVTSDISIPDISDFISKLKLAEPQLDIPDEQRGVLKADIATIEAQVKSPKPKRQTITESLHSIRAILEGAGGALVATGLLDTLQHLHF